MDYRARFSKFNGRYQWHICNAMFALTGSTISENRPYLFKPDHHDFAAYAVTRSKHLGTRHAWAIGDGLYSPPGMPELAALLWDLKQEEWGPLTHSQFLEFCLLYWILRQEGELSADAWGVVLRNMWAVVWVALHYCIPSLTADETARMFELASDEGFHFVNATIKSKRQLPEVVTVYRGTNSESPIQEAGYSWSIDADVARLYLARKSLWQGTPILLSARVHRGDILGFVEGEHSQEAILSPRRTLIDLRREEIDMLDTDDTDMLNMGQTARRIWANAIAA